VEGLQDSSSESDSEAIMRGGMGEANPFHRGPDVGEAGGEVEEMRASMVL
jgi:hypothetical protein